MYNASQFGHVVSNSAFEETCLSPYWDIWISMQTFVSLLFWAQYETLLRSRLKLDTTEYFFSGGIKNTALNIYTLPTVWWLNNFERLVHHQYKCVCKCHLHINIHLFHRSAVRCRWCAAIKGRRIHGMFVCTTPNMDMQGLLAAQSHFQTHASFPLRGLLPLVQKHKLLLMIQR